MSRDVTKQPYTGLNTWLIIDNKQSCVKPGIDLAKLCIFLILFQKNIIC